jgi:type IV pilus assembly PilX-like protein
MAIIVALTATLLMSALGAALILTSSSEALIAANFRNAQEGLYAADAALERSMDDLGTVPDWNVILDGSTRSAFVDGAPSGVRTLADGSLLDLGETVNMTNCRKPTPCSASELTAITATRPWGANNPVWRMFAYGPLSSLLPAGTIDSLYYVIVMVADDPNPGTGVLVVRAEAFGPRGTHQVIESAVGRPEPDRAGIRVLSWRLVR